MSESKVGNRRPYYKQDNPNYKHGGASNGGPRRELQAWYNMHKRCSNPKDKAYADYKAMGVTICERWNDFALFIEDMGRCPAGFTLERIRNNEGYYPGNCKWASPAEQMRNTRRTRLYTRNGKTQCAKDWCRELGVAYEGAFAKAKRRGVTLEEVIFGKEDQSKP